MIPYFYFNVVVMGLASLWCFVHLPGHGFRVFTSSNFVTSLILAATVVGLIRRHPLALTVLIGIAGLLCCVPVSLLTSGFTGSAGFPGSGLMSHLLPAAVPGFIRGFADDLVFNIVLSTFALITFRVIRSDRFSNFYEIEKISWARVFASMGALLVLFMLNYKTAEKAEGAKPSSLDTLSTLQTLMSNSDLQEALATGDMNSVVQKLMEKQQNGTPEEKKAFADLQKQMGLKDLSNAGGDASAKAGVIDAQAAGPQAFVDTEIRDCRFTFDDSRLGLVLSTQELAIVDLRTRQMVRRKIASSDVLLGPDLDLYFDPSTRTIGKMSDPQIRFPLAAGFDFLSFTSEPREILVYNPAAGTTGGRIERLEIPSGRLVWGVNAKLERSKRKEAFTSLDLRWAYLKLENGKPFLFNIANGQSILPDLSFSHIQSVEFGSSVQGGTVTWVRFSGQSDDGRTRLGLLDIASGRVEELPIPDTNISLFDRDRKLYLTSQSPIQLKRYTVASDGGVNVSNQDIGITNPILFVSLLSGGRFVALAIEGQNRMSVLDFDQGAVAAVGAVNQAPYSSGHSCFAVSPDRQLFAAGAFGEVQIFWTSELAAAQPRSLTIPLAPVK